MKQPTRPARAVRPRHDENAVPTVKATTLKAVLAKETAPIKGEAKRKAFGDVSNVAKQVTASKSTGLTEKANKIVLKEKDQIAVKNALAKPAQRGPLRGTASATQTATSSASTLSKTSMPGPAKRVVKKTEVYADKRPSPPKPAAVKALSPKKVKKSPKSKTGHIIQRETRKVGPQLSGQVTLKNSRIDNSNKLALSHIQDEPEAEGTDEDATDVEDEEHNAYIESEEEYFDEDDEDYTTARSKTVGDNTTGLTAPILAPKLTAGDKRELLEAGKDFQEIDEDDLYDITMVAEYGDEIFEYMRELEVRISSFISYLWSLLTFIIHRRNYHHLQTT